MPTTITAPLDALRLPADDWLGWLDERGAGQLELARQQIEALKAAEPGSPDILRLWNDASIARGNAGAIAGLLTSVHPDPAVLARAEELELEVQAFGTALYLDPEVFAALQSVPSQGLDADATRLLERVLRDFRRSGVDRDESIRQRVRDLEKRLSELEQQFSRVIRDGHRDTAVPAGALDGLPDDYIEAHPAGADGNVTIGTDYPDLVPLLTYSTDAEARRRVAHTYFNLGWPENEEVLAELLQRRHELATLLGYSGWPDYDAEVKMIGSGAAIAEFIDSTAAAAEPAGRDEIARLLVRAEAEGESAIDLANWRYYLQAIKRDEYGVDAAQMRTYFSFDKVKKGLLDVTGRLFGLTYTPVDVADARPWHPDVTTYDVTDAEGRQVGRIHLDLHPRDRKFNHAAQFNLVTGVEGRQLPEGVLVCNLPRGLMEHRDVVTLFHEFGHLLHHLLGGHQSWVRFSGVATEWDFVEAPSQLLEEWAWDAAVLAEFATDADGRPIPAELVAAMKAGEEFGKAFLARTQMFYAALSYRFHQDLPTDRAALMRELYDRYSLIRPLPDTHFYAGFGHLGGYTSAYYTYMWSLVIAKDLFSAFDPDDLFDTEVAARYRDRVLVPGGSRDAAELVADFLGRPYNTDAFAAWLNR